MASVVDGDTVILADGERVRLLGVNAPEVRRRVGSRWVYAPQPGALAAMQFVRQHCEGRPARVQLDPPPYRRRDKYDRLLAYLACQQPDGTWVEVNLEIIRDGLAKADRSHEYGRRREFARLNE